METKIVYAKLLEAQKEIGAIKKDSDNPFFKSKYFDINSILKEIKPILNKHGLLLTQSLKTRVITSQGIEATFNGQELGIETTITCIEDGSYITAVCVVPQGSKPQETGSAITYFRRYSLQSMLALEAEDDDGNVASGNAKVYTPKSKNVDNFMKDLQPTDEDVIKATEKLESATTLKELKEFWTTTPPLIQDKLKKLKEDLKFKLS